MTLTNQGLVGVTSTRFPLLRLRDANEAPVRADRDFVLYWMIGARRTQSNFALERACDWSRTLMKPLLIFEPLRIDYPWASLRLHRFIIDGMAANAAECAKHGLTYYAYVEPGPGHAESLLYRLAEHTCLIITDDVPAFFLPRMIDAAAPRLPCLLECVDGWGLLPSRATNRAHTSAYQFRRFLQRELRFHLRVLPQAQPLKQGTSTRAVIPVPILDAWPPAELEYLRTASGLAELPLDDSVLPAPLEGGPKAAARRLRGFIDQGLDRYHEHGNNLDAFASSGLSPYLHFGHIGAHQVWAAIIQHENWSIDDLAENALGRKEGWWGMQPGAEAFLDELSTWRELAANSALYLTDFDHYSSLPDWARATLQKHRRDRRPFLYTLNQFACAATHDPLWNAAQRQLLQTGTIHRYLRMLWGKLILEWSADPEHAFDNMVELNNRYALDGRDANSWAGIAWVLGRYDHPWPERPIYGTVRSMSSTRTARKLDVRTFLHEFGNT